MNLSCEGDRGIGQHLTQQQSDTHHKQHVGHQIRCLQYSVDMKQKSELSHKMCLHAYTCATLAGTGVDGDGAAAAAATAAASLSSEVAPTLEAKAHAVLALSAAVSRNVSMSS